MQNNLYATITLGYEIFSKKAPIKISHPKKGILLGYLGRSYTETVVFFIEKRRQHS